MGFSFFQNVQNGSDTHPASYSKVTEVLPGAKRSKCDTGHSPPSSAEFNNEHDSMSAPTICLLCVDRDNSTFTFTFTILDRSLQHSYPILKTNFVAENHPDEMN